MTSIVASPIGVIVNSDSHIQYWCQAYGPQEIATPPSAQDYAFGQFVQVPLPAVPGIVGAPERLVGIIYDTVLVNPAFGMLGPRLSTSDEQRAVFSPDYLTERATLLRIMALGTVAADGARVRHGVPDLALALGAVVAPLSDAEVRAFHMFADHGPPGGEQAYLHMGYLPQMISERSTLLQQVALHVLARLHRLVPEHQRMLGVIQRNLAWKLSVETAG
jgi:hypothetical protein